MQEHPIRSVDGVLLHARPRLPPVPGVPSGAGAQRPRDPPRGVDGARCERRGRRAVPAGRAGAARSRAGGRRPGWAGRFLDRISMCARPDRHSGAPCWGQRPGKAQGKVQGEVQGLRTGSGLLLVLLIGALVPPGSGHQQEG
ncbi:hypothetical protein KTU01_26960 [Kocuria turfanensis]|uniref:Uncharacterized protein n=1 Tax=Kocuria turfanensis TaxID=388357 RepID=A0A512IFT6_9MICC|nr:hypothetical protein KTU01_26960 [Kocuria turfanensis]